MHLEQRHGLWLVAGALLAAAIWLGFKDGPTQSETPWLTDLSSLKADMTFEGIRYRRDVNGLTQMRIEAQNARFFETEQELLLEGVTGQFFSRGGDPVRVEAAKGQYRMAEETMTLSGAVELGSSDGRTLKTERLVFDQGDSLVWSKDPVRVEGRGLRLEGRGLEYDLKTGRLTVHQQTATLPQDGDLSW